MCCIFSVLLFLGPRAAIIVWWLLDTLRFRITFDAVIWPILGTIFLPWTTLMYLIVYPYGFDGWNWLWLALGLLFDLSSYGGGGYGNRKRLFKK